MIIKYHIIWKNQVIFDRIPKIIQKYDRKFKDHLQYQDHI